MAQYTGKVAWFNNAKGYGFVSQPEGPDVFVHFSGIVKDGYKTLKEGQPVEFDVTKDARGKDLAVNVRQLDSRSPATEA